MSRYVSALWGILCTTVLWYHAALGAEPNQPPTPPSEPQIKDIQVTDIEELNLEKLLESTISLASGKVQSVEEAPGIVSVIKAETIRRIGARTLQDVLEIVPGFEVLTNNLGRNRIIVRGLPAIGGENVLVLFNGHRLNEVVTGGATSINLDIPVDNLARIEIIRGPGSALFGTNAFAGVINLVPSHADSFEGVRASAAYGSFDTQQFNILGGHQIGDLLVSGFVQYSDTDGPGLRIEEDRQSTRDMDPFQVPFGNASRAPGDTDDERRSVDANIQLTYKGFMFNARVKDERSGGYIGLSNRLSDSSLENRQIGVDVSYRYALGEQGNLLTRLSFTQNELQQRLELLPPGTIGFLPRPFPNGFLTELPLNSRRFNVEVLLNYPVWTQHLLTFGMSFAHETTFNLQNRANSSGLFPVPDLQDSDILGLRDSSRDIFSVLLQDIWTPFPELEITLGVRYDYFSDFGDTIDPRVGAVWRFAEPFYLKLLYGSAFRAPSFFELTFNGGNLFLDAPVNGNDDLDATTLQTIEVALGYTHPQARISANYFLTFVRDFIELAPDPVTTGAPLRFMNNRDIDIQGVEFELQASWQEHNLFFNYTYQYAIDEASDERVPNIPEHLANLGASVAIGPYVRLTPTLLIRGNRPRSPDDDRGESSAYALVNTTVLVQNLFQGLELSATISNILDTSYEHPTRRNTIPGDFPRPGRSVLIKATYTF